MGDILIVDDERDIRELIADILEDEGFSARKVGTADDCMREVMTAPPNLLILDIWLKDSDMDGIDILKRVKKEYPNIPVVIISGHGNIEIAVAAIKQGAYDFIEKPFNIDQLLVVIKRAMETSRLRHENTSLRQKDRPSAQMLGESPAFKTLVLQLEKLTKTNSRVLLTGPSGCGKELAARYIHNNSERAQAPFVVVNCASIEADKMDSVLFGHEDKNKSYSTGLLEQANGGTVYLDEVADMPLATQSKLLRVLVDQGFSRLGGVDTVKVDFRVISSTSQNLSHAIEKREFREELFHRLNVVPVEVPSLSERSEDIPLIAGHFLKLFHELHGHPIRELSADAAGLLQTMPWPGNIRQLANVIERILILSDGTGPIEVTDIPDETKTQTNDPEAGTISPSLASLPLREAREAFERDYLMAQIKRFSGNISKTANFVGMERSALHRKLKSLGVVNSGKSSGVTTKAG